MTYIPGNTLSGVYGTWVKIDRTCPKCGATPVEVRTWESSDGAYEDEHYHCISCQHYWWIDGIDS